MEMQTKQWIVNMRWKYPTFINRILFGILRRDITKDEYLFSDNINTMKVWIIDHGEEDFVHVPAQWTPSTIYDILIKNISHGKYELLQPFCYQSTKQLQVAILSMFEFSSFIHIIAPYLYTRFTL